MNELWDSQVSKTTVRTLICLMLASPVISKNQTAALGAPGLGAYHVYFGTYTGSGSKGIYRSRFDAATGELTAPELEAETKDPTFLALGPNQKMLYAVNEVSNFKGKSGAISAYSIDEISGRLNFLNQEPSGGAGPCHLAVERTGKSLAVANYGSGSVALLPLASDGHLQPPSCSIQHQGSSINPQRQEGPHAHFITWDLPSQHVLTCDLGLDKVLVYKLEPPGLSLVTNNPPFFSVKPGSGPRHLVFHPAGRFAYLINEMASTVTVCSYDVSRGALDELQTISTLPKEFSGNSTAAEIAIHPSGRFLYASNRGNDSIAVFGIDSTNGKLRWIQTESTQGKTPRHFVIDPSAHWLIAENQDSGNVVVFALDSETGRLTPTKTACKLAAPVCAVFRESR